MESIIILKPEDDWRQFPVKRWFAGWPVWLKAPLAFFAPEQRTITKGEILTELQQKTAIPGVLPTFLQPIQTRLVMLQTGFRAMMGVKIYGSDLKEIERIGLQIEQLLKQVPGATDIVADRIVGKPYLEFEIDRDRIARYGVNIRDVQDVIEIAIGGMNLMESVEGRERYPIRVRYLREFEADDVGEHQVGQILNVDLFSAGQLVGAGRDGARCRALIRSRYHGDLFSAPVDLVVVTDVHVDRARAADLIDAAVRVVADAGTDGDVRVPIVVRVDERACIARLPRATPRIDVVP